jgi:hypothetical protein
MVPLRASRKILFVLAVAFACAVGAGFLPDDPYQRWQLLDGTIHANARWMYERSHFDPTPIDVVFLGPSRMGAGIIAPRLGKALAARGLPSNVVNFSTPEAGRNTNWAAADMLFAVKKPKLVVLGVTEKPQRFGHPAFKYIGRVAAIADPGYPADVNYFSDLIYLPFRQMRLAAADWAPGGMGLAKQFDPARYRGSSVDTTQDNFMPDAKVKRKELPATPEELARQVKTYESGVHPPILPRSLADVEFGDERHYVREIAELAERNGAKVAFLFLPYYTGPSRMEDIQELKFYKQFGPVLNPDFLPSHAEFFGDYAHVVRPGAEALTDWLVEPVAQLLKDSKTSP